MKYIGKSQVNIFLPSVWYPQIDHMEEANLKFAAVGDIALSHHYDSLYHRWGPDYPFEHVRQLFKDYDIVLGNLEAPFSIGGETYPLKCSLKAHPKYINGLKRAGFSIFSLSNNHILDFQEKAFFDTITNLNDNNILCFGAGRNLAEARKPTIVTRKDISIGFLGYCDVTIDSPFVASESFRGISSFNIEEVEKDITDIINKVDIIIVSLHWGIENYLYPTPEQILSARKIVDFGADLIIGHHPHVLQGIEKYRNGYIAYSLGNFLFSEIYWTWINNEGIPAISKIRLNKRNREGAILSAIVEKNGIKNIDLIPCFIADNLQVKPICNHRIFHEKILKISRKLHVTNYKEFWYNYKKFQLMKESFWSVFNRSKRFYKIRPKHIKELCSIFNQK